MHKLSGGPGKEAGATRVESPKGQLAPKPANNDEYVGAVMTGDKGRYSIMEFLNAGGMGRLYVALDANDNSVVVKVISPNFMQKSESDVEKIIRRFFKEAKAAALVDHENVIRILDVGSYKETVFCVMERLQGIDLDHMARKHVPEWQWLAPVMMDVCDGVQAAHERGIIHRDLSPDNIFLAEIGGRRVVKVLDFGLAKFTQEEDEGLTKTGVAMGKLTYMAPEQAEKALGQRKEYDHRVDVYALGIIMYKLLTGVPPFKGENDAETLFMRLNAQPKRPREINPSIPQEVEDIILKAMARHEHERYQSASELKAAIIRSRGGAAAEAKPASDDMFLGDILESMERRSVQADMPHLPAEISNSEQLYAPHSRSGPGAFGKFMKWVLVLGTLGGLAYGAYRYRDEISNYVHDMKNRYSETSPSDVPSASPGPSASAMRQEGYLVSVESTPPNASVYEVRAGRNEYLGATPLNRRFEAGEHALLIKKRGYVQRRITVSEAQPSPRVNLMRYSRPQAPREEEPESELPEAPEENGQNPEGPQ